MSLIINVRTFWNCMSNRSVSYPWLTLLLLLVFFNIYSYFISVLVGLGSATIGSSTWVWINMILVLGTPYLNYLSLSLHNLTIIYMIIHTKYICIYVELIFQGLVICFLSRYDICSTHRALSLFFKHWFCACWAAYNVITWLEYDISLIQHTDNALNILGLELVWINLFIRK